MQQANFMLNDLDGLIRLQAQLVPAFKVNEYLLQGKTIRSPPTRRIPGPSAP